MICHFFPQFPDYLPCSVMLQPAPQDTGKVGLRRNAMGSFVPSNNFLKWSFTWKISNVPKSREAAYYLSSASINPDQPCEQNSRLPPLRGLTG